MNAHRLFFAVLSSVLMPVTAITARPASAQEPLKGVRDRGQLQEPGEYRIGPEDVLQISVWKNDALSRIVPVRPDGMISLPLVNDVRAAGLTPTELRELLAKRLTEYIPNPEVSVLVADVRSFRVTVIGEVLRPGRFELRSRTTVLDVLALAGGFSQFASRSGIVILRTDGRNTKRVPFNYNKVVAAGGEQENFSLQPGDIVLVP